MFPAHTSQTRVISSSSRFVPYLRHTTQIFRLVSPVRDYGYSPHMNGLHLSL